jgi:hypothetical protein
MTTQQAQADAARSVTVAADAPPAPPLNLTSPALRIMLDDRLFERCQSIARFMSNAHGMLPDHLIGQPAACFAVVNRALAWNLDPYAVGACTYPTPGGRVGFEGKLVSAVLEASGRLIGGMKFRHLGDWSKLVGKFVQKTSKKGRPYMAPAWTDADEVGLGVEISAHIRGEAEPRSFEFWLVQAHPRNSTLWATDPRTQIVYLATRRFANLVVPHLFMGLPFDGELVSDELVDVTNSADGKPPARPRREDFGDAPKPAAQDDADEDPDGDDEDGEDATGSATAGAPRETPANEKGGDHVGAKTAAADGQGQASAADPRTGMNEAEREKVEREADAMQRAEARARDDAAADTKPAAAAIIKPTAVPMKKDGSPDWIKWHTAVVSAGKDLVGDARKAFAAAHEPALRNYELAFPQNAATLRLLLAREP